MSPILLMSFLVLRIVTSNASNTINNKNHELDLIDNWPIIKRTIDTSEIQPAEIELTDVRPIHTSSLCSTLYGKPKAQDCLVANQQFLELRTNDNPYHPNIWEMMISPREYLRGPDVSRMWAQYPGDTLPLRYDYYTCVIRVDLVDDAESELETESNVNTAILQIREECVGSADETGGSDLIGLGQNNKLRISIYAADSQMARDDPPTNVPPITQDLNQVEPDEVVVNVGESASLLDGSKRKSLCYWTICIMEAICCGGFKCTWTPAKATGVFEAMWGFNSLLTGGGVGWCQAS
ncbi:MAG: hypothetical protein M1827_000432 [Pycnora praestabilis]|nr:MAG: hypothetical protein M1827_000432 [Pycnora praestabilis]